MFLFWLASGMIATKFRKEGIHCSNKRDRDSAIPYFLNIDTASHTGPISEGYILYLPWDLPHFAIYDGHVPQRH